MDRQREAYAQMGAALQGLLAPGEVLHGFIVANQQKTFSMALYLVATTDRRIILQPVNRQWQFSGPPVSYGMADITNSSVWGWAHDGAGRGEKLATFLSSSGDRIKFEAGGEKWKLMALGGNILENALADDAQLRGLDAFIGFLAAADQRQR